jgi:hypothetical protein
MKNFREICTAAWICSLEGGWDTGVVGIFSLINTNSRILIENPLGDKTGRKNDWSIIPIPNFYVFANVFLLFDNFI